MACDCSPMDVHDYGPCGEDCGSLSGRAIEYTEAHEPHDEQVQVWSDNAAEALLPWLKAFDDYEDKLAFFRALADEIKDVAVSAHAAGMIRARKAQ
jgi:hypothetical protein